MDWKTEEEQHQLLYLVVNRLSLGGSWSLVRKGWPSGLGTMGRGPIPQQPFQETNTERQRVTDDLCLRPLGRQSLVVDQVVRPSTT